MAEKKQDAIAKQEHFVEFIPFGAVDKLRLTASMVRQFIAVPTRSGALPSERDCIRFIMLCMGKRLNPFEGDAFLIGYDSDKGPSYSMVSGVEAFLKRAEQNASYDGIESGVILSHEESVKERPGSLVLAGEKLIGGWCRVYRKDQSKPVYKAVKFETYDTGKSRWAKDPGGMIEKVAKSQGLREAFPTPLGGLYTQEEMEKVTQAGDNLMTLNAEPISMPKVIEVSEVEAQEEIRLHDEQSADPISNTVTGIVQDVTAKTGKGKKGPWTCYGVQINGEWYSTFDANIGKDAQGLKGLIACLTWKQDGKYKHIVSVLAAEDEPKSSDPLADRIEAMEQIDPDLYNETVIRLGITAMTLDAVEAIEAEFNKELDARQIER